MERMNLKKVSSEIRAYLRTRIIYFKKSGYEVKETGKLLNVADDYVYQVLKKYRKNGNITPTFKIPINFEMFQAYTKFLKNIFGFIVAGVIIGVLKKEKLLI